MNTKLFLLFGTSLSLIPTITSAQCVATQDCATLGYTENSCSGGNGVKCPFGNKWACFQTRAEIEKEICTDLGFTQTCTGTGYAGGVGKPCNGKYSECKCNDGYIWNDSSQKCEYDAQSNCVIGALYYADGTCSNDYISSKKLLGIVIYEKSASENGWVMAHKPIATRTPWSTEYVDIPELTNITSESNLTDIQASCTNTDIITAKGNSSKYPAAWAAKNYKEGDKTWCLPSAGLLKHALDNQANFTKFNVAVYEIQAADSSAATILGNVSSGGWERIWSSSEHSNNEVWIFLATTSYSFNINMRYDYGGKGGTGSDFSVRPVMPF